MRAACRVRACGAAPAHMAARARVGRVLTPHSARALGPCRLARAAARARAGAVDPLRVVLERRTTDACPRINRQSNIIMGILSESNNMARDPSSVDCLSPVWMVASRASVGYRWQWQAGALPPRIHVQGRKERPRHSRVAECAQYRIRPHRRRRMVSARANGGAPVGPACFLPQHSLDALRVDSAPGAD